MSCNSASYFQFIEIKWKIDYPGHYRLGYQQFLYMSIIASGGDQCMMSVELNYHEDPDDITPKLIRIHVVVD